MNIDIAFEGDKVVPYRKGREITMDVSPFLIFLATAGMCSAVFVKAILQQRGISLEGVKVVQKMDYNFGANHVNTIDIHVDLPTDFLKSTKKRLSML